MYKAIVLVLALFFTAQCINPNVTDADAIAFLEGFGPAVGQPNATLILVNCTQTQGGDALNALKDTIQDLQDKDIHGAYENFMSFIQAVDIMKATCPDGAGPFAQEFDPAYQAFNASKKDFLDTVDRDIARDDTGAIQALLSLGLALDGQDYFNAGGAFGNLTVIALAAYLNNTPVVTVENNRFVFDVEFENDGDNTEGSGTEFFMGFAEAFGLTDAAKEIVKCVDTDPVSLFSDIDNLINDISNSNWGSVITDLLQIYDDIDNMVSECPDGAEPFINEFQPVVNELSEDSSQFWDTVGDNIKNHLGDLLGDVGNIIQEISESEWSQAGEDFGNIFFVTLAGILPNSTEQHKIEDVFALAEVSNDGDSSEGSATEFFMGFAEAFGLTDAAQQIMNCVENDPEGLITDIQNLINDISNSNWGAVVTDLQDIFSDIDNMVSDCPDGANPFINEFEPVIEELSSDSSQFWDTVGDNIKHNLGELLGDVGNIIQEISESEWSQAGEDFGNIFFVTLAGILPNSTEQHKIEDVFALAEVSNDGDSSEGSATEFFLGFAEAFGLTDAAQQIMNCVENDPEGLITDIQNLINDISNSNWGAVVTDLQDIFSDIDNMVSDCPDGANPFINEFEPVIEELSSDSSQFWDTVGDNIKHNLGELLGDVGNIIQEISESEWSQAGEDFGNIFFVTLAGILPNSTQQH